MHSGKTSSKDPAGAWIATAIEDEIRSFAAANRATTAWKSPLVGIADAVDPLFPMLKEIVRPSHALPQDLLPSARSVIGFFLPFEDAVPKSNRQGRHASTVWARAYVETNALIAAIGSALARALRARGYAAALVPATHNFDEASLMSDWSHKHVAYIAGLGTFGLHHMLITDRGCAGRLGSLVTDAALAPTARPDHKACLYKHDGTCGVCISRCPAQALSGAGSGFDRHGCYAVCLDNAKRHSAPGLADVCGKCACGLPCTAMDPVAGRQLPPRE